MSKYNNLKIIGPFSLHVWGVFLVTYLANKETMYSYITLMFVDGSQQPFGLRRGSVAALLLAIWVRIPLG